MDTPRDILERYAGGEYVTADQLRAATAWMLAAWDAVMEAAGETCTVAEKHRAESFEDLLHVISFWDCEVSDMELDLTATAMLPCVVAQHQDAVVVRRNPA